jgi:hypothetical protein
MKMIDGRPIKLWEHGKSLKIGIHINADAPDGGYWTPLIELNTEIENIRDIADRIIDCLSK